VSYPQLLTFDEYQRLAALTDQNPISGIGGIRFPLLGLFGETGSLVSELKKKQRDHDSYFAYETAVVEELGDTLWYLSNVATHADIRLSTLAEKALLGIATSRSLGGPITFLDVKQLPVNEVPRSNDAVESVLIDLAGKVGTLLRDLNGEQTGSTLLPHLVEILSAVIETANTAGVSLDRVARRNLIKSQARWPTERIFVPLFDENDDPEEQLPREIEFNILERASPDGSRVYVRVQCRGINIGDRITDNKAEPDDYRFHDVFHLAYAAILGWSPVTRALFKVKRKSTPQVDDSQDGARAALIEEGVSTLIFNHAQRLNFFESIKKIDFSLLKIVREMVVGFEVDVVPYWQWEEAILAGYSAFRALKKERQGVLRANLRARTLTFDSLPTVPSNPPDLKLTS